MADVRMPDLNKIQLAGRVTWGPDYKAIGSDNGITKFGIAYNRKFKKRDNSQGEESFFMNCEVWGRAAEWARDDLYKGCKVIVEGDMKEEQWEKDGVKHSKMKINVTKIHQLEWKEQGDGGGTHAPADEEDAY